MNPAQDLTAVVQRLRRGYPTPYEVVRATATLGETGWDVDVVIRVAPTLPDEILHLDQWDPAAIASLDSGGDAAIDAFALVLHANIIEWWDTERPHTLHRPR